MKLQLVQDVLNEFIKEFKANPFNFLYEFDIHSRLISELKNEFDKKFNFNHTFENGIKVNFSIVRSQYHPSSRNFLDIAILEKSTIEKRTNIHPRPEDVNEMFLYWQKVDIGIEVKFQAINTDQTKYFSRDVEKLKRLSNFSNNLKNPEENCINTGIALLFFHRNNDLDFARKYSYKDKDYNSIDQIVLKQNHINSIIICPKYSYISYSSKPIINHG